MTRILVSAAVAIGLVAPSGQAQEKKASPESPASGKPGEGENDRKKRRWVRLEHTEPRRDARSWSQ
jgi:hypothetical protein